MTHILWELAKNPEYQIKLRAELDDFVSTKGNTDFTAIELESMPYLNAVIKVGSHFVPESIPLRILFDNAF